jgi:hypothetical protein
MNTDFADFMDLCLFFETEYAISSCLIAQEGLPWKLNRCEELISKLFSFQFIFETEPSWPQNFDLHGCEATQVSMD